MSNKETHAARCLAQLRSKDRPIEKYIYLSFLKEQDPAMFYDLCLKNMAEFTPLIYTPTVGDACLQFSHIYRRPEGLYVSIEDKGNIKEVLANWPRKHEARISVVTDGAFDDLRHSFLLLNSCLYQALVSSVSVILVSMECLFPLESLACTLPVLVSVSH